LARFADDDGMGFSIVLSIVWLVVLGIALALLIASLVALGYLWYRVIRGPKNSEGGICARCGYNVRDISTTNCPECGTDLREVGVGKLARAGAAR
jgi:hypothetical protein